MLKPHIFEQVAELKNRSNALTHSEGGTPELAEPGPSTEDLILDRDERSAAASRGLAGRRWTFAR